MTLKYQRYAIYWTPAPETPLASFAEAWFANAEPWDYQGPVNNFGLPQELAESATQSPARYRLHATIKAPFRLHPNATEEQLRAELDSFTSRRRAIRTGRLHIESFEGFVALVLRKHTADVNWLAADCVTHFDRFRAPLNDHDRARRTAPMSPRQAELFEAFGYPYVLSEFKFHITLAGPLKRKKLDEVAVALAEPLKPALKKRLLIDGLTLLGEPEDGCIFQIISRHPFALQPQN